MKKNSIKRLTAIALAMIMMQGLTATSMITTSAVETQQAVSSATTYTEGDYKYTVSNGKATITRYTGSDSEVNIPSAIGGYNVTAIGDFAFNWNLELNKVVIPEGVNTIGYATFELCVNLKEVSLPETITTIDDIAFADCGILNLKLPEKLEYIGGCAFYGCHYLKNVNIPSSIKNMEYGAFGSCNSLKSNIVIPSSIDTLRENLFDGCSELPAVLVPDSVHTIEEKVFNSCKNVTVFGSAGSDIQKYCLDNNYKFRVFSLDKKSLKMRSGESCTLKTNLKSKELAETCIWTSSDESVATVTQDGKIEAVKSGKATITATAPNGLKATCEVAIGVEPEKIELSKTKLLLGIGVKYAPKLIATANEDVVTNYTWTSSDESVATVNQFGNITTVGEGKATITVTSDNGKTAQCEVTVRKIVKRIKLPKTKMFLKPGQKYALKPIMSPDGAQSKCTWTSSNENIATVNRYGNVTAVSKGTAYITVTTGNGKTATCTVIVK